MNKLDAQLKTDIENELRWEPKLDCSRIDVKVKDGVVSLDGFVDTYADRSAATAAVMRVSGAHTIDEHLAVELAFQHKRSDGEIEAAVHHHLTWDVFVPRNITATVKDGVATLVGHATWNFQRVSAEHAIRNLLGIRGVVNAIAVRPDVSADQIKERIERALRRQATTDGKSIEIEAAGSTVTLSGQASSWEARRDAWNAAWAVPGVTEVVNHVTVA